MRHLMIFIALLPTVVCAQIVDIDTYRQSVIDYSYTLRKASSSIDYARYNYAATKSSSLPSLTLTGGITEQLRKTKGQESWSFSIQPQLSQTIYNGGGIRAEREKAMMGVEIAELDAAEDLLDVCYNADYNYYNLAAMKSYNDAVSDYVEIVSSLRKLVALRYNEGYIAKGDLLMIETRLSEAQYEQIAIEEDYTIALQKFNILRGYDPEIEVEQQAINIDMIDLPRRIPLNELLERRPDFLAEELAVAQAESNTKIVRAAYNPSLSANVLGVWQPLSPNINGSTIVNGAVSLSLSAPIFNFGKRQKSVGAALSLEQSSQYNLREFIDNIRLEESNTWAKIVDSYGQLIAARKALSIGSENLKISTFAYSEGKSTILDVMQAQISWLQLYTNSIWSEFNYLISISAYQKISGIAQP